jgi:hypothetical protein
VGQVNSREPGVPARPFNGPVDVGLRSLAILTAAYPASYSVQRLVALDYLVVHSDDVPDGPTGLHPRTPHRGGELLVRRGVIQEGLLLYQSRGLVSRRFADTGVAFAATERSAGFLDALGTDYVSDLRDRSAWLVERFGDLPDGDIALFTSEHLGEWGAEFESESVLWTEESV